MSVNAPQAAGDAATPEHRSRRVLIIDADPQRGRDLGFLLQCMDYGDIETLDCTHWQAALEDAASVLCVIVGDCGSPEASLATVDACQKQASDVPILLMDAAGSEPGIDRELSSAVVASFSYPPNTSQLANALNKARIYRASRLPADHLRPMKLFRSLVGHSKSIQHVRRLMEHVAGSDANVLIFGDSGTGKEVVARNLHYHSSRRDKPFVPINCGAIPADLLESELFGHEKGAFTGAISTRQGRFELAECGTLFLDEIGDMPLAMQVKLLRVIQERTFERVGSNRSIQADVRIIAATHRNLETLIKDGRFREDLYYRLNVFPIEVPPLRERASDIPLLVNELVTRFEHEKRGSIRLTPAAVMSLCQYPWPGNVRELANLVERLVILYPYGVVDVADLPEKFRLAGVTDTARDALEDAMRASDLSLQPRLPRDGLDLKQHLVDLECSYIKQALDESKGVVAHAARLLNMRRTTLVEKMRKYKLDRYEAATNS